MKDATVKQIALIKKMEQLIDVKFTGKTIREASKFITQHTEEYQEKQAFVFEMTYNENNY